MTVYYLDTSALVKGYANEVGSQRVQRLLLAPQSHTFYTARLAGPEMVAALFRKTRTREIPRAVAVQLTQTFKRDWRRRFRIVEIDIQVSDRAMELAEQHGLRGYDAVHLASALLLHESRRANRLPDMIFLAADVDLLQAAAAAGLCTDNPNQYA